MATPTAALLAGHTERRPHRLHPHCPTVTVDGYTRHNASSEAFGSIPLQRAFGLSCDTAFINLARTRPMAGWQQRPSILVATPATPHFRSVPSARAAHLRATSILVATPATPHFR
ncbi:MAG: hypothetical protein ACYCV4_17530, partial [Dermatophilaceae bacterium]